jgi:hypothetical protein
MPDLSAELIQTLPSSDLLQVIYGKPSCIWMRQG